MEDSQGAFVFRAYRRKNWKNWKDYLEKVFIGKKV